MDFTFGTRLCTKCMGAGVTFGNQKHGGPRYCYACLIQSEPWLDLSQQEQTALTILFRNYSEDPIFQARIRRAATMGTADQQRIAGERS